MFKNAILRRPGTNYAQGLTTSGLGPPEFAKAVEQHERYREALERCGLEVTCLEADPAHPDAVFVEDTAVLAERCAVLARPGAASREGEVEGIREAVGRFFPEPRRVLSPGTLDGGDICQAGDHFFIGVSHRTNEEGARQLSAHLADAGYTSSPVDIRGIGGILHLKSGMAYLGEGRILAIEALAGAAPFEGFEIVRVPRGEEYAANCVRVNDRVLFAAGYPETLALLAGLGYETALLDVSEYRKMDGGLSCLSLRF